MRKFLIPVLASTTTVLLSSPSFAQVKLEASASAEGEASPKADAEATTNAETDAVVEESVTMEESAPAPTDDAAGESQGLDFSAFVDGSLVLQTARMGTGVPPHRAYAGALVTGAGTTSANGFSLNWVGLNVGYDAGAIGATISLRAGTAMPVYNASSGHSLYGIDNITQGYLTYRPTHKLELDFGQFGTIYGAEVAESWMNLNYTRGGLYFAMQPFWHTGLRASYAASDSITVKGLLVNGVNSISEAEPDGGGAVDPVFYPTIGAQVAYASDKLDIFGGGLYGTETDADSFNVFLDLVAVLKLDPLTVILNADYNVDQHDGVDSTSFYGVSLAAGYTLSPMLGLAGRIEHLVDADNTLYGVLDPNAIVQPTLLAESISATTLTATVDVKPLENDNFVLRWDNRYEIGSHDIYADTKGAPTDSWFATVIGLVVQGG